MQLIGAWNDEVDLAGAAVLWPPKPRPR